MTLRHGETLLLTVGIPVVFLVFFSEVHVLPTGSGPPVDFLVPGVLALAVMSTAMISLGIATGFERGYGVLKRLGSTPLGRDRLLGAKITTVVLVELVQAAVLVPVGLGLGWNPGGPGARRAGRRSGRRRGARDRGVRRHRAAPGRDPARPRSTWPSSTASIWCCSCSGGMLVPLAKLPGWSGRVLAGPAGRRARPTGLHATLGHGRLGARRDWVVLAVWAVAAPVAASLTFRWE